MATKKPTKKTAKKAVKKSSLKPNMLTYNVPDLFCLAMIEDHQGNFHCNMSNVTYPKLIRAVAILKSSQLSFQYFFYLSHMPMTYIAH